MTVGLTSLKHHHEAKSREVIQLSRIAQQARQTYEQMTKNQRSLLNPLGGGISAESSPG